jgi:Tol biopolymer transport system component
MRTIISILAAGLLLAGQADKQAEVLLQAAQNTELVQGDLEAAIGQYKKILATYGGSRAVAAKALVRMGHCYERLGNAEARRAYERVVREYVDQSEAAGEARARLAVLGQPAGVPATRQVWAGRGVDTLGSVSPDGRYLSFVDWDTGNLAMRDLATGENRPVTKKVSWDSGSGFALFSRISPDGKQIAYNWFADSVWEVRVGGTDGPAHRSLYRKEGDFPWITTWSPDGKQILVLIVSESPVTPAALVSVADGSARTLKTASRMTRSSSNLAFSPDGRFMVYDLAPKEDSPERDIFSFAVEGGGEVRLVEHPADDYLLGWTPDGKRILFASDRAGTLDAWTLAVNNGRGQGQPELVKKNIGRVAPLGFARNGAFYYGLSTGMVDVYTASLDFETGKALAPPARAAQRFIGSNQWPDWSRDGRQLAYISGRGFHSTATEGRVLCVTDVETGKQRDVPLPLGNLSSPRWSPDGRSILVKASDRTQAMGFYRVDAQTGQATLLARGSRIAVWSGDGKSILLTRFPEGVPKDGERVGQIISREVETGAEKEIYREAARSSTGDALIHDLAVSPDGRSLAFTVDNGREPKCVKIVPTAGGEAREIYRTSKEDPIPNFSGLAWTPDGRELLCVKPKRQEAGISIPEERELWAMPVPGGPARRLGLSMAALREPRVAADGKRVAFTAGRNTYEVWVMENFLPGAR